MRKPYCCTRTLLTFAAAWWVLAAMPLVARTLSQPHLPLAFEANQGQAAPDVKFFTRAGGATLALTSHEAILRRTHSPGAELRMNLVGTQALPIVEGIDELPGRVNYFRGSDSTKWHTDIRTYARVKYRDIYPGIDLVYYGNQRQLEYDFVVRPGAQPRSIRLAFSGARALELDASGDLILRMPDGLVRQHRPRAYQEVNGIRREIASSYRITGKREARFQLASYNTNQHLVIDPTLTYSTWLGGNGDDQGKAIGVDPAGNVYVMGTTRDPDADLDIFVLKFDPTGTQLLYGAVLGGSGDDYGNAMAIDGRGAVYLAGYTFSYDDFPITPDAVPEGGRMFVTKLDTNVAVEASLVYSTQLPGTEVKGIAIDSSGNIYLTGEAGGNFLITPGAFQTEYRGSLGSGFVMKIDPSRSGIYAIVYSSYLGGNGLGDKGMAIAVDRDGNAIVTGSAGSTDFPVINAYQRSYAGGMNDAFVAKMNAQGSALVYSTFLGSSDFDEGHAVAVDDAGNAYVTGITYFTGFPTTAGAFRKDWAFSANCLEPVVDDRGQSGTRPTPCPDAFITKFRPDGSVVYSTYLGGNGSDVAEGIAVDAAGNAYVTGWTSSLDFPTANPLGVRNGGDEVFVSVLTADGSGLLFSTYLGGGKRECGKSIAMDAAGNIYLTGYTASPDFPVKNPVQDAFGGGLNNAFVAKISP